MPIKLAIGLLNYRNNVSGTFLDCMLQLTSRLTRRFGPGEVRFFRTTQLSEDAARNVVWQQAQDCQAENLLFIDDDMTFTFETFETLWNTPGDIVSALYFIRRDLPSTPCMYTRLKSGAYYSIISYQQNTVMEVDAVGFGFVLIRKPVLDALDRPFMKQELQGEDKIFCQNAKAAGFKVLVNTASKAGHLMTQFFVIDETTAGGTGPLAGIYGAGTRAPE